MTPKPDWNEHDYAAAAETKRRRFQRLVESFLRFCPTLQDAWVLDVGCGDGANCMLMAREQGVRLAVGIDLHLPLLTADDQGQLARRLMDRLVAGAAHLPVQFVQMDGTRMAFRPDSFDIVMSRSAMEHIQPVDQALEEMVRAVRSGGLIYLGIDPFFWLRGCHKRGVVDIPWAHARLSLDEYQAFVAASEGHDTARKRRNRLQTLNRFTVHEWQALVQALPCELLDWKARPSELGEEVLQQHPDVLDTLLPGIDRTDLLTQHIEVWLRKR